MSASSNRAAAVAIAALESPDGKTNKRFLFEITDDEHINPAKRVRYAEQLPQTRKTENQQALNESLSMGRQAFLLRATDMSARKKVHGQASPPRAYRRRQK